MCHLGYVSIQMYTDEVLGAVLVYQYEVCGGGAVSGFWVAARSRFEASTWSKIRVAARLMF
jgi:hypothetical protein